MTNFLSYKHSLMKTKIIFPNPVKLELPCLVGHPISRTSSKYLLLVRLRERLKESGYEMDPEKVLHAGIRGVQVILDGLGKEGRFIGAFLTGVFVGNTILYGKEWAWLCAYALNKDELDMDHWQRWVRQRIDDPPNRCFALGDGESSGGDTTGGEASDTGDSLASRVSLVKL